ncbi:MAG: zinc-finger domain-containing protein [Brachymonas sp.]|nr:zinc-finger domain-containing protein [Brachymonas sp.]
MPDKKPNTRTIELTAGDLTPQGTVACPSDFAGMPAWASHPRIYLHLDDNGQVQCPYCNNIYKLVGSQSSSAQH